MEALLYGWMGDLSGHREEKDRDTKLRCFYAFYIKINLKRILLSTLHISQVVRWLIDTCLSGAIANIIRKMFGIVSMYRYPQLIDIINDIPTAFLEARGSVVY